MNRDDTREKMTEAGAACLEFMRTMQATVCSSVEAVVPPIDKDNLGACGAHCSLLAEDYFGIVEDLPELIQVPEEVRNYWPQSATYPRLGEDIYNPPFFLLHPFGDTRDINLLEIPRNEAGVQKLLSMGRYRLAANFVGWMLLSHGYGTPGLSVAELHTPLTIRCWLTRFAILIREYEYILLHREWKSMDQLQNFQFESTDNNTQSDGDKGEGMPRPEGHIPCFCFRLLIAKIPMYFKTREDTLTRLFQLFIHCQTSHEHFQPINALSGEFWHKRQIRVGYAIATHAIRMQKYELLNQINTTLIANCPNYDEEQRAELFGAWAVLYHQLIECVTQWLMGLHQYERREYV